MIKISKLADYAMVLMHRLSPDSSASCSAKQLAAATAIPLPTVSKVLKLLSEANLVRAHRGAQGGYWLATPPEQIAVTQVIEAIDGPFAITECNLSESSCSLSVCCELRSSWQFINQQVVSVLEKISLQDMQQQMRSHA